MKCKRVIARLDVKNNALVKGIHLEGLRVLGKPEDFAKKYYEDGIDELIYMDVVASLYNRNGLVELVRKTAEKVFIPITAGGGVRNLSDVKELLSAGADKVCVNTAAIKDPDLIPRIADVYGASTIVVAIEAIKTDEKFMAFTDNGREYTGIEVVEWASRVVELGAGEILLTSVDTEGTGKGFNFDLIDAVRREVTVPVIAHGGAGSVQDLYDVLSKHCIDAVGVASMFHYNAIESMKLPENEVMGNKSFLRSKSGKANIEATSVVSTKDQLKAMGLATR